MAGAAVTRFSFTCPEPGDLAWLQSRWRHGWDLGWDDEYVAVSKGWRHHGLRADH
jgi:hypothetical protein